MIHHYEQLVSLFNGEFATSFNTLLIKGDDEPVYVPAGEECRYHQIVFANGFYASALHEIAHWCIAGAERRKILDYGYWYCADGRDEQQQAEFESVEVKPQALEWCFSVAAGFEFKVSTDNLNGAPVDRQAFQYQVYQQVKHYLEAGLPTRAQKFVDILRGFYHTSPLAIEQFQLDRCYDQAC